MISDHSKSIRPVSSYATLSSGGPIRTALRHAIHLMYTAQLAILATSIVSVPQVEMLHNANYRVLSPFFERSLISILYIRKQQLIISKKPIF